MLTIHHLGRSQSERIVWLCEELGLDYALQRHERDAATIMAPPELRELHPIGTAPVLVDGDLVLAESGAIVAYILARHGGGRLTVAPDEAGFADYLYWFHFANGTLMPVLGRKLLLRRAGVADDAPVSTWLQERMGRSFGLIEARLAAGPFFAGEAFTAADIMMGFPLTTMRQFVPVDYAAYPNLRAYLQRIRERPAYARAMTKGDPGMPLTLG